jgi:hypothetical protein
MPPMKQVDFRPPGQGRGILFEGTRSSQPSRPALISEMLDGIDRSRPGGVTLISQGLMQPLHEPRGYVTAYSESPERAAANSQGWNAPESPERATVNSQGCKPLGNARSSQCCPGNRGGGTVSDRPRVSISMPHVYARARLGWRQAEREREHLAGEHGRMLNGCLTDDAELLLYLPKEWGNPLFDLLGEGPEPFRATLPDSVCIGKLGNPPSVS